MVRAMSLGPARRPIGVPANDLEILEYRGAVVTQTIGGKVLSDQRILK